MQLVIAVPLAEIVTVPCGVDPDELTLTLRVTEPAGVVLVGDAVNVVAVGTWTGDGGFEISVKTTSWPDVPPA